MSVEKPRNIHQRMLEVMRQVDYVAKERKKVNGQYTFVSHDAVVAAIRPHLLTNGIATEVNVEAHSQDGNRTVVDLSIAFINVDEPQDRIVIHAVGHGIDNQDKGIGKAVSYGVKYALLKTFMLETGDDPERDSINYSNQEEVERKALYQEIKAECQRLEIAPEALANKLGKRATELTIEELRVVPSSLAEWFPQNGNRSEPEQEVGPVTVADVVNTPLKDLSNHQLNKAMSYYAQQLELGRDDVDEVSHNLHKKLPAELNKVQLRDLVLHLIKLNQNLAEV